MNNISDESQNITIRKARAEDLPSVITLLKKMGWVAHTPPRDEFVKLLEASFLSLVAVKKSQSNEEIVGFIRTVSDGMLNGYITMVAVEEGSRGQGIGKLMVETVVKSSPNMMKWVLTSASDGVEFWEKMGFIHDPHLMCKPREKLPTVEITHPSPRWSIRVMRRVLRELKRFSPF